MQQEAQSVEKVARCSADGDKHGIARHLFCKTSRQKDSHTKTKKRIKQDSFPCSWWLVAVVVCSIK